LGSENVLDVDYNGLTTTWSTANFFEKPMSKHHGEHSHEGHKHHGGGKRSLHKDWRLWVGVILMLVAMAVYVMTLDESIIPGSGPSTENERVPAAAP
jgi:hypothetical protein